jgi:hypothetical protein
MDNIQNYNSYTKVDTELNCYGLVQVGYAMQNVK